MEISTLRHSRSHILAQAVQRTISCNCQLGIGPAIDDGFYYDILFAHNQIQEDDLASLTKTMHKIAKESQSFTLLETTPEQSHAILQLTNQTFKEELRNEFLTQGEKITFYINTIPTVAKDRLLTDAGEEYHVLYDAVTAWVHKEFPALKDSYVTFIDMCAGPHIENTKELEPKAMQLTKIA
jgi:threonyl-tRNA synthetase